MDRLWFALHNNIGAVHQWLVQIKISDWVIIKFMKNLKFSIKNMMQKMLCKEGVCISGLQ